MKYRHSDSYVHPRQHRPAHDRYSNRHRIGVNVIADNFADLAYDSLLTWRNSGSVLLAISSATWPAARRWPLFRPQRFAPEANKADTDATEDHWNADFRDDMIPNAVVGAQTITRIMVNVSPTCRREYRRASAVLWGFSGLPA